MAIATLLLNIKINASQKLHLHILPRHTVKCILDEYIAKFRLVSSLSLVIGFSMRSYLCFVCMAFLSLVIFRIS